LQCLPDRSLRIFYNRPNYKTTYQIFEQLRANVDKHPVHLIASHPSPDSTMLLGADEAYLEPPDGDGHVDWLLDVCRKSNVDVFVPRADREEVAERIDEFHAVGTNVVTMDPETIRLLENKDLTYRHARDSGIKVPDWRVVRSSVQFASAISAFGDRTLISKPVEGVGAQGFRVLVSQYTTPPEDALAGQLRTWELSIDDAFRHIYALEKAGKLQPLLIMPYLESPEVSVDVLARRGRLLAAIPRVKRHDVRSITDDPRVLDYTERIVRDFSIEGIANVQVRWLDGDPVLLEVNGRAAGGSSQAALTGVDLHWEAIRLAYGLPERDLNPRLGLEFRTIERIVGLETVASGARRRAMLTNSTCDPTDPPSLSTAYASTASVGSPFSTSQDMSGREGFAL
jgi:hypothetical protein